MPPRQSRPLFGGAIVADLPADLKDASDIRQVPDNQEVFLYPDLVGPFLVIEILQRVSNENDLDAVKFHFEALAHDNEAISSTMQESRRIPNDREDSTPSLIVLRGVQSIRKFNQTAIDQVEVLMALFRVQKDHKSADIVVSANIPRKSGGQDMIREEKAAVITSDFDALVLSLRIVDYNLFA
ncbi:hypothetical protein F5I97DRAFT_1802630 [Phlebopus sp. FC_14]|nr:hypothetical protein F5I97DRAFT_1802630 [Phlebopus sp. FC_14]